MSTLSQFFNSAASSGAGGVSYFGTSGSLTVPSDATYIAYGAMGAGSSSNINSWVVSGGAGGGFSWWEGAVNCASPFNLTVTVGSAGANGGTSIVSGGPNTVCATGGLSTGVGGIGYCGLINTCGGTGCVKCYNYSCCNPDGYGPGTYVIQCARSISAGGSGGLLGDGGPGSQYNIFVPSTTSCDSCAGGVQAGGGFGSGGGAGASGYFVQCATINSCGNDYYRCCYQVLGAQGGGGGQPGSNGLAGNGLNGVAGTPGYAVNYNLNGKLSQAKTFLSASGGGATAGCGATVGTSGSNWAYVIPAASTGSAGAGGGGAGSQRGGFGGGGGSCSAGGCGGGGGIACYYYNVGPGARISAGGSIVCSPNPGGNGFVAVEYWK